MVVVDYDYSNNEETGTGYVLHLPGYVILRYMHSYYKLELEDYEVRGIHIGDEYDIDRSSPDLIPIDVHEYYNNIGGRYNEQIKYQDV